MIAAFIMLLVVREPKRGAMDPPHLAAIAHHKSGFGETFWEFVNRPALLWTALGCGATAFLNYAALNWNVSFLRRTLGMSTRTSLSGMRSCWQSHWDLAPSCQARLWISSRRDPEPGTR